MTDTLELTAKRIADQGRDALLARLRPAFADAASAHADILHVDDEQLEQMVQRAADRADGLQWRRALATVASQELGIGLGEALGHPAVERAQAIVGAPSYEDSLAALEARPDAPVALDRRPKMAPPSRAEPTPAPAEPRPTRAEPRPTRADTEPTPAPAEPRPTRADTTPTAPAEPRPTRADDKPTRPDPDVTRVAKATPAPANPASAQPETRVRRIEREPEQPEPRVRRIEREPEQPERTVRRVERPPSRPESDVTRVQRRPTQPGPERRSTQDAPAEPRPKPASAAARAGQRPAASSAEQRPTTPQTRRSPAAPEPEQRPAATQAEQRPTTPEAEQPPAAQETRQRPTAPEPEQRPTTPEAEQRPAAPETRQAPAAPEPEQRPAPRRAAPTARSAEPEGLRVSAIHLGGVANLKPGESEIELRLSEHGLDIARESGQIIGRLGWSEIEGIEVPPPRGFMWRRRAPRSHLVVRAGQGDASFEIPSVFPDELSEHLRPVLERYGRGTAML